ncbi:MAG: hypothetical protein NPIRA01_03510 [Nitrospirales bacterium]|nr:MAG: hypothetical protein NPIRA01_03510 [Nitrospirales bacterium]
MSVPNAKLKSRRRISDGTPIITRVDADMYNEMRILEISLNRSIEIKKKL